jgi:hypothetical protein
MDQLVAQEMKAQDAKWISIMRFRGQGDDVRSFAVKRKSCSEYKSICLLFEYNSWWRDIWRQSRGHAVHDPRSGLLESTVPPMS